jgi:hypothetical protein
VAGRRRRHGGRTASHPPNFHYGGASRNGGSFLFGKKNRVSVLPKFQIPATLKMNSGSRSRCLHQKQNCPKKEPDATSRASLDQIRASTARRKRWSGNHSRGTRFLHAGSFENGKRVFSGGAHVAASKI